MAMESFAAQWGVLAADGSGRLGDRMSSDLSLQALLRIAVTSSSAPSLYNFELLCPATCSTLHALVACDEDPAVRRHAAKAVFGWLSSHLDDGGSLADAACQDALLDSIVASLLDIWSQIRKDSAKLLFSLLPSLPQQWVAILAQAMHSKLQSSGGGPAKPQKDVGDTENALKVHDWRVLEGAVLTLAMLVKRFEVLQATSPQENPALWDGVRGPVGWLKESSSTVSINTSVRHSSSIHRIPSWVLPDGFIDSAVLPLLAHQQKTLRDTAVQLVAATTARCPADFTEHMLETMLQTLIVGEDGMLPPAHAEGCLALLVLLVRRQALPLPAEVDSTSAHTLWSRLSAVISSYVGHAASTVRQAASKLALQLAMAPCAAKQQASGRAHRAAFVLHVLKMLSSAWKTHVIPALVPVSGSASALQSSTAFNSEGSWQLREGILFCYEMITHYLLQDHARLLATLGAQDAAEDSGDEALPAAIPAVAAAAAAAGTRPGSAGRLPARAESNSPEISTLGELGDTTEDCTPAEALQAFPFGLRGVPRVGSPVVSLACHLPLSVHVDNVNLHTPVKVGTSARHDKSTPRPVLLTDAAGAPRTPSVAPSPWASVTPHISGAQGRSTDSSYIPRTPTDTSKGPSHSWSVQQLPAASGVHWQFGQVAVPVPVCVLTALQGEAEFHSIVQDMLFHTQLCVECPKFELKRMGGQLLPSLADVCMWVAPDAFLRLAAELGIAIPLRASQAVLMVGRVFNRVLRRSLRLHASLGEAAGSQRPCAAATYVAAVLSRTHSLLTCSAVQLSLQGMAVRAPSDKCLVLALDTLGLALRQGAVTQCISEQVRPVVAALLERCSKVLRLAGAFAHAPPLLSPGLTGAAPEHQTTSGVLHAALALCDELALSARPAASEESSTTQGAGTPLPSLVTQRSVGFSDESERWASRSQWRRASRQAVVVQSLQHAFSRRLLPHWFAAWTNGRHVAWLQQLHGSVLAAAASWAPASLCDSLPEVALPSAEELWRSLVQPQATQALSPAEDCPASGASTPPMAAASHRTFDSCHTPGARTHPPATARLMDCVAVLGRPPSISEQLKSPEPAAATPAAQGGTPVSAPPSVLSATTSDSSSTAARPTPAKGKASPERDPMVSPDALSPGGIGTHSGAPEALPTSPGFALGMVMFPSRPSSAGDVPGVGGSDSAGARQQQAQLLLLSCVRALLPDILSLLQDSTGVDEDASRLNCNETALLCSVCACWAGRLQSGGGGVEAWEALSLGIARLGRLAGVLQEPPAGMPPPAVWLQHWTQDSFLVAYLGALAAPHSPAAWAHCSSGDGAVAITAAGAQQLLVWDAAASTVAAAVAALAPELLVATPAWVSEAGGVPVHTWGTVGLSTRRREAALVPSILQVAAGAVQLMASLPLTGAKAGAAAAWGALSSALLHRSGDCALAAGPSVSMSSQLDSGDAGFIFSPQGAGAGADWMSVASQSVAAVAPSVPGGFGGDVPSPSLHMRSGSSWSSPGGGAGAGVAPEGLDPVHWRGQTEELPSFRQSRRHLAATLQPIEAGGSDMEPTRAASSADDAQGESTGVAVALGEQCPDASSAAEGADWDDWDEESSTSDEEGSFGEAMAAAVEAEAGAMRSAQMSLGSMGSPSAASGALSESLRSAAAVLIQAAHSAELDVSVPDDLQHLL